MTTGRRATDRQARHRRILDVARELAERDGWDGVTTRRLADAIGYTQPVLYSHFPGGKTELVDAVAVDGFAELAVALAPGRSASPLRRLVTVYLDFAAAHPALYAAMFAMPIAARFADARTPDELRAAFEAIRHVLPAPRDTPIDAEVFWAALHGLATLEAAGRLPARTRRRRIDALVSLVSAPG